MASVMEEGESTRNEPLPGVVSSALPSTNLGTPLFKDNEKVLCFHGPLIYEGKVLKLQQPSDSTVERQYLIHYAGWSKKWDEYVPESRVLKHNEENLKRQKEHKAALDSTGARKSTQKAGGKPQSSNRKSTSVTGESVSNLSVFVDSPHPDTPAGEDDEPSKVSVKHKAPIPTTIIPVPILLIKRRLEVHVETETKFTNKQEIEIKMPDKLKTILIEDFDQINRQKKLLRVPGRFTVDVVLSEYKQYMETLSDTPQGQFDFVEGVKDYFNAMLGSQLLYKFERQQYGVLTENIKNAQPIINPESISSLMSSIYGPVHLIRLFSKLGHSMAFTTLEQVACLLLKNFMANLFQFIMNKSDEYFRPELDYEISSLEYQRQAPN